MDRGTWCTKEDVLKDLSLASGQRIAHFDDSFFVVGEQPPPLVVNNEDDEIELQYGPVAAAQVLEQCDLPEPDLTGITKMLRMVQDYENFDEETSHDAIMTPNSQIIISKVNLNVNEIKARDGVETASSSKLAISQLNPKIKEKETSVGITTAPSSKVFISKLNPNVKEFVPRCIENEDTSCQNVIQRGNIEATNACVDTSLNSNSNSENSYTQIIDSDVKSNTKMDALEAKEQKKQLVAMLKNQITAKRDTFEDQRKTDLAIVNLLKLYAKPSDFMEKSKPVKLYTPEFFKNCMASEFVSNDESEKLDLEKIDVTNKETLNIEDSNDNAVTNSKCMFRENDNNVESTNEHNVEVNDSNEATALTPGMADTNLTEKVTSTGKPADREVTESISKVNNWLDNKPYIITISKKEKPKSPALYLGAVAYKRKELTCKSPSEIVDKKISKQSEVSSYKPSSYADELHKKYKEKSKKLSPAPPTLNIWEKLEQDLKKKDQEIKNRKNKVSIPAKYDDQVY